MFSACADVDRKSAAHVGDQLVLDCAARDVIAGSGTPTGIGCPVMQRALFLIGILTITIIINYYLRNVKLRQSDIASSSTQKRSEVYS